MPFIFQLSSMVADLPAPCLPHWAHQAGPRGRRHGPLRWGVMASVLPNPGIARLRCPEIGDRLHGLGVLSVPAPLRAGWPPGHSATSAASRRSRQSVAGDLLFLAAWNRGEIPELWAYLRARQLRRAGATAG